MDKDPTTGGSANTKEAIEGAPVERLHSRRTVLTGAAMGVGAAAAAVGAMATASPAGATAFAPQGSRTGRTARTAKVSDDFNASADFTVQGTSSFSDVASFARSGVLSIGTGKSSATFTGVALTSTSLVLATLQNHLARLHVVAVVPNVAGSSFEVFLSRGIAKGETANVAWFIVN